MRKLAIAGAFAVVLVATGATGYLIGRAPKPSVNVAASTTLKGPPPNAPRRQGLVVTYTGNHFSSFARDAIFTLARSSHGGPELLNVVDTYLKPGDKLRIDDDQLYDFDAGTRFFKVTRLSDNVTGFVTVETMTAETKLDGFGATPFGSSTVYHTLGTSADEAIRARQTLLATDYAISLSAGEGKGIHPVTAAATALGPLLHALTDECDATCRVETVKAGRRFFELYGFQKAVISKNGAAWAYEFDWPMHWGVTLEAPWYSGYANAVMALNAALMFKLTQEEPYRDLARKAVQWLFTPVDDGGALYFSKGREFLAEYAYSSGVPAVRVYDGEMKAVLSLYNLAVVLEDPVLLRRSFELAENLSAILPLMQTEDGLIVNARYPWLVDSPGYTRLMKLWASQLSAVTKNSALRDAADKWRLSPSVWE